MTKCQDCKWWSKDPTKPQLGECHLHPTILRTKEGGWCKDAEARKPGGGPK